MNLTASRQLLILSALIFVTITITGCDDSGVVGSTFRNVEPSISVDAVSVGTISVENLLTYSGGKSFVNAGRYNDDLFGYIESTALIKPTLLGRTDSIPAGSEFYLRLVVNGIYGDTTSAVQADFDLYEVTQRWRQNEWYPDSQPVLADNPLTSFSVLTRDTVRVPLPNEWIEKYLEFYYNVGEARDSAYVNGSFGFAIVPQNEAKIAVFNTNQANMIVMYPDSTQRTAGITQRASSYSIDRTNVTIPATSTYLMNDFSETGRLSFFVDESVTKSKIISRAELVIYEDTDLLNATLGQNEVRYNNNLLRFYDLTDDDKNYIIFKDPVTGAARTESDGSYRVNVTNQVSEKVISGGGELTLYLVTDLDSGILRPNLLVSDPNSPRAPKLIITTINPE